MIFPRRFSTPLMLRHLHWRDLTQPDDFAHLQHGAYAVTFPAEDKGQILARQSPQRWW